MSSNPATSCRARRPFEPEDIRRFIDCCSIRVTEISQVGEARRSAKGVASALGASEAVTERIAIVATEMATNLVKHARGGGEVLVRAHRDLGQEAVDVLAIDRGKGISNLALSMSDGYSTSGSPGTGLGAIQRLSSEFDLHTIAGQGTTIFARIWLRSAPAPRPGAVPPGYGVICVPSPGEGICGDSWAVVPAGASRTLAMVADGLGHGPAAAEASAAAAETLLEESSRSLKETISRMHGRLRHTRGAAVAVVELDSQARQARFAGVGNIAGVILLAGQKPQNMVSHNGTVGGEIHRIHEFSYDWAPGATIVLHSDGLQSRWGVEGYPGILMRHPSVLAATLYRDWNRGKDDSTALVVREARR